MFCLVDVKDLRNIDFVFRVFLEDFFIRSSRLLCTLLIALWGFWAPLIWSPLQACSQIVAQVPDGPQDAGSERIQNFYLNKIQIPERFRLFVSKSIFLRILGDPKVVRLAIKMGSLPVYPGGIEVLIESENFQATVVFTAKERELEISIPYFKLYEDKVVTGKTLPYQGRPGGLNRNFARFMVALSAELYRRLQKFPSIEQVQITASETIQKDPTKLTPIRELLETIGFETISQVDSREKVDYRLILQRRVETKSRDH